MKTIYIGHTEETPFGDIWVAVSERGLLAVEFPATLETFSAALGKRHAAQVVFDLQETSEAIQQLREYTLGKRTEFTLPIDWLTLKGFQHHALRITFAIPYGQVRTYKEIANEMGNPRAARAVGRAQATNPMPLVIPCHRVIGSDRKLHGYGGGQGLPTKERLLQMEQALIP